MSVAVDMSVRCRCAHPDHDGTCRNAETWACKTCGTHVCTGCTEHHACRNTRVTWVALTRVVRGATTPRRKRART